MASETFPSLDQVEIATPCDASWDEMQGDDYVRHCEQCQLNVFDLSPLTRAEAEKLVFETEGRLCVRFFRRDDGTVLTKDCPVGLRNVRRRLARSIAAMAALVGFLSCGLIFGRNQSIPPGRAAVNGPLDKLIEWIEPAPGVAFWGGVCKQPAPPPQVTTPVTSNTATPNQAK